MKNQSWIEFKRKVSQAGSQFKENFLYWINKGEDSDTIRNPQTNDQVICDRICAETDWVLTFIGCLRLNCN